MTAKSDKTPQIVFMTDGQPTVGQTNVDALLSAAKTKNASQTRLFTFGVGDDVNARLLDALASENRGASDYVTPTEDIETKVGALYEKIAYPVLASPKVDFGGLNVYDVYPPQLPDLFRGSQATVIGRFRGAVPAKISLTGQSNGQAVHFDGKTSGLDAPEMPKLWATRKVGYLLEDARRAGRPLDGEVRDEIIKLSQKYGIVTPLTAALVTEDQSPPNPVPMLGGMPMSGSITRRSNSSPMDAPFVPGFRGGSGGGVGGGFAARAVQDSGAAGVAASQSMKALQAGRSEAAANTKTIAGKTFALQDGVWTDTTIAIRDLKTPPRIIKFASDEYFKLLKDEKLAQWLSAGERVRIVWNGEILQIEP